MDRTPSISSSRNHGLPDETGMEQVQSDLKALKGLYGLLQKGPADENFDETSRAYLMKMLDDATETALLRQAKMISGSLMPPGLERNLSLRSGRQTRAAAAAGPRQSLNLPAASTSLGVRQVSKRLHRIDLLHHSPSSSRDGRHVYGHHRHAAEEAVLSRLPSNRSSRTAMPLLRHHTGREQPNSAASRPRLNLHNSLPSSRLDGRHAHSHNRHAAQEPVLSRLASSIRSSRTAMPPRDHPTREQQSSGPSLYRLSVAATSQNGTVTGRSPRAELQGRTRPIFDRADHSSLERGSTRRSAVSRKLSLERERPPDHATVRRTGAEGSSSTRDFGRLDSGLSLGMPSRAGRGVATPRYSSSASSNEAATIRSRIRPHRELTKCSQQRDDEEEEESCTPRRRSEDDTASSTSWSRGRQRRTPSSTDSSRSYTISSSGAASSFTYTSSTVSPAASSGSASSYYSSTPRRGSAQPAYASEATSDSSRSRRRRRRDRERKERREGRLRRLTKKIAMVFHHRHDHHHHHHYQRGQESPPPRSDRRARNRKSPWTHLGGLFHRTKGQDKKTASQTTVSVLAKKRGGGDGRKKRGGDDRHMHVLFGAMRHLRGKRKAPASVKMRKMASRVQVKKMHWWKQLRKGHLQPRHRLGHAKAM